MQKLIDYAVEMMSQENTNTFDNPTQNPELNPTQNPEINSSQNIEINATQNKELAPSQNPLWKEEWWSKFKELVLWEHMTNDQKRRCLSFLQRM